jgi:DNA-binding SARP family transcriptional activator/tetratricopeptide (TPR) repeat protein
LLALFLSQPNRILSADVLIDSLWSEDPPPSAATALRVHLSRLRARLEPNRSPTPSDRLVTEPAGYRLRVERDELDSVRFEQLVLLAQRAESSSVATAAFAEADALWRGAAFADLDDVDLVRAEAVRLEELRANAIEEFFDIGLARGEHAALVGRIRRAVEDYPLRERLAGQHMIALYRSGRQAEALRAYTDLRARLGEELGIEPDVALARLETAIIRHEPELDLVVTVGAPPPPPAAVALRTTDAPDAPGRTAAVLAVGAELGSEAVTAAAFEVGAVGRAERAFAFASAADAVRCAVELLTRDRHTTIGISVGDLRSDHSDGASVVREATALRQGADRGCVLASEAAMLMAGPHLDLEFDPPYQMTIDATAVVVATGRLPARAEAAPLPGLLVDEEHFRFAGRSAELELLDHMRRSVEDANARVALISGEPGIGKTRLAAEAAQLAHAQGWDVLYGRCDEGVRTPFQPFVDALEYFVAHITDDELPARLGAHAGELTRLIPGLGTRLVDFEAPLRSDPETERYQMFQAVADWLRTSARRRPVMLVLDDLQWAAQPTLLLLRHLVRMPDLEGLFLVATYRDTKPERSEELDEILADLSRVRRVERVELTGLDVAAVYELLARNAGATGDEATEDLAMRIHAETAGNPFFAHELIRHLAEPGAAGAIPTSVRDVVAQRLGRLPNEVEDLLNTAAVIGRHFDFALLCAVSGTDEDTALYLLDRALEARLVQETGFDEYEFAHALVQSALYVSLTETRRVRLHRRVGEALETLSDGHPTPRLPELAHHFLESAPAGAGEKAVRYAMDASDAALASLAFEDAANLCRRGLVALEQATAGGTRVDPNFECDLVLRLGRAELRSGQLGARDTLLRAFGLARVLGDPSRMAEAVLAINRGWFSRFGRTDRKVVDALEYAIAAQRPDDSQVLAELLATLASEVVWSDDGDLRYELSERALAMARRVGDARTIANVLLLRNLTIASPDTLSLRVAECDELLSIAEELRDPAVQFQAAFHRSGTAMEAGNVAAANEMVDLAGRLARELHQPSLLFHTSMMRTSRRILEGALDEAERGAYTTFELGQRANQGAEALIFFTELLLEIRRWQGRLSEMLPEFADLAGTAGIDFGYSLVRYLYDAGECERAVALYQHVMREQPVPPRRDLLAGATLCNLAYLAARAGDKARAQQLYDALLPLAGSFANTTVAKPITEHFLGLLAATFDDVACAEDHFAVAVAAHEKVGAPLLAAESRVEWARLLLVSGADPDRAARLTDAVTETATNHSAPFLQEEVHDLLLNPPTTTPPPAPRQ